MSFDKTDPRTQSQQSTIEIESVRDHLRLFEGRYKWTGDGREMTPESLNPAHRVIPFIDTVDNNCHVYYVGFKPTVGRGKTTRIELVQKFYDEKGETEPRLSKTVSEYCPKLTLKVEVHTRFIEPSSVIGRELRGNSDESKVVREEKLPITRGVIEWTPKRVVKGRRYQIEWEWADYPAEQTVQLPPGQITLPNGTQNSSPSNAPGPTP